MPNAAEVLSSPLADLLRKLECSVKTPRFLQSAIPLNAKMNHLSSSEGLRPSTFCDLSPQIPPVWVTRAGFSGGGEVSPLLALPNGAQASGMAMRWRLNLGRCVDASALVVQSFESTTNALTSSVYIGGTGESL